MFNGKNSNHPNHTKVCFTQSHSITKYPYQPSSLSSTAFMHVLGLLLAIMAAAAIAAPSQTVKNRAI